MSDARPTRIGVAKTHKLFIDGAFPRSESGRTHATVTADGSFLANVANASRKDVRDAVTAARRAADGWASRSAYNRGQVLYRVAEVLESRRRDMAAAVVDAEGMDERAALAEVDAAVDRIVWYAGWTDKVVQVFGNANPVAGPYFNVTTPEPVGVVGVLAPQASSLLGLVSVLLPPLAVGSTVVLVASRTRPGPAVALAEVLATSDVPPGVVNLLTGDGDEIEDTLASHGDVGALDLTGAPAGRVRDLVAVAADTTTRIVAVAEGDPTSSTVTTSAWHTPPTTARMRGVLEHKTVWHPARN